MKLLTLCLTAILAAAFIATGEPGSVSLTWDPSPAADKVTSYVIYRLTPGSNPPAWLPIGTSATNLFTLINQPAGTTNTYSVTARNAANIESLRSNELIVPPVPGAPQNLRVLVEITVKPPQ